MVLKAERRRQMAARSGGELQKHLAGQDTSAVATLVEDNEAEPKVALHDLIDGTITQPINKAKAEEFHLRKVVYACSACMWTSTWPGQFTDHVKQMQAGQKQHARAKVVPHQTTNGTGYRCTGCSSVFSIPGRAQMHVDARKKMSSGHAGAQMALKRRFEVATHG